MYVGKSKKIFKAVGVFPGALRLMGVVGRRNRISTNQRPVRIFSLVVFVQFSVLSNQNSHILKCTMNSCTQLYQFKQLTFHMNSSCVLQRYVKTQIEQKQISQCDDVRIFNSKNISIVRFLRNNLNELPVPKKTSLLELDCITLPSNSITRYSSGFFFSVQLYYHIFLPPLYRERFHPTKSFHMKKNVVDLSFRPQTSARS